MKKNITMTCYFYNCLLLFNKSNIYSTKINKIKTKSLCF